MNVQKHYATVSHNAPTNSNSYLTKLDSKIYILSKYVFFKTSDDCTETGTQSRCINNGCIKSGNLLPSPENKYNDRIVEQVSDR